MGWLIANILGFGGAAVALFYPYVGLLDYVALAILKPESLWFWSGLSGGLSRNVAMAMTAGWALKGFGNWRFGKSKPTVFAFVGFLAWSAMGAFVAPNQEVAWEFVSSLAKIVWPFMVGLTIIDSTAKLKQLAWVIVISQGYVAYELNMMYLGGFNRIVQADFGGMDNNSVAIGMVTGVGLAFFLGQAAPSLWQKGLAYGSALLMAHVVLFSLSRGGMVALIITGALGFFMTPPRTRSYGALVMAVLVVLQLSGPDVRKRFLTVFSDEKERDASATSRIKLWGDNWDLMLKYPLFGVGPHHWPEVAPDYGWPKGKEGHSLWLQIGAELGFPGLMLLVYFYGSCLWRLYPIVQGRSRAPPELRDLARMVFPALVGFAVAAQFVSLTFLEVPYYVTLLGAGVLKLVSQPQPAAPVAAAPHEPADQGFEHATAETVEA